MVIHSRIVFWNILFHRGTSRYSVGGGHFAFLFPFCLVFPFDMDWGIMLRCLKGKKRRCLFIFVFVAFWLCTTVRNYRIKIFGVVFCGGRGNGPFPGPAHAVSCPRIRCRSMVQGKVRARTFPQIPTLRHRTFWWRPANFYCRTTHSMPVSSNSPQYKASAYPSTSSRSRCTRW